MDIIGLDLHKRESQLSIRAEDGTIAERRIVTSRERFTAVLGRRPRARILLEARTESEWVARGRQEPQHCRASASQGHDRPLALVRVPPAPSASASACSSSARRNTGITRGRPRKHERGPEAPRRVSRCPT